MLLQQQETKLISTAGNLLTHSNDHLNTAGNLLTHSNDHLNTAGNLLTRSKLL